MSAFKFNLGDELKDLVTGVIGVVVARTEWLNGCRRYTLDRPKNKEGVVPDAISVDEQQTILVKALKVNVGQPLNGKPLVRPPGGPRPAPTRARSIPKAFGR